MARHPRQRRALQPDTLPEQRVFFALLRAHDRLTHRWDAFFGEHGVTAQQYNALRVLYVRDEGEGLCCNEVGARLLTRVPDVTRLLDRLERLGLVVRKRSSTDRREVRVSLTDVGFDLVEKIHGPSLDQHRQELASFSAKDMEKLTALLDRLLAVVPPPGQDSIPDTKTSRGKVPATSSRSSS